MMLKIILIILFVYLFIRDLIPFILFPGYLFSPRIEKTTLIKNLAKKLKAKTKEQTLKNIFEYAIKNHSGITGAIKKVTFLKNAFRNNPQKIIDRKVPLYCHNFNLVIKTLLINTGQIKEKEIITRWQLGTNLGIHQYLLVNTGKKLFKLDSFYNVIEEVKK